MHVHAALLALSLASTALAIPGDQDHIHPVHRVKRADAVAATTTATRTAAAHSATITASAIKSAVNLAAVSALPLTQYTYSYADIPYQVNPYVSTRGPQSGYNICNSTTAGDDSSCQTLVANNISDFCLWGSDTTGSELSTIGDIEAATVAYCSTNDWGARLIKSGAITGVQVLRTQYYTQWTGYIDQTALHLEANDTGGELDPHGGQLAGGLVYSSGLPGGDNKTLTQAVEWNNFIGGGVFCLKLCSPNQPSGSNFCKNTADRMGCAYNMPASYIDNEFTDCDSELQDIVGVYDNGASTYTQPPEPTAPAPPYTPRIPASSNCKTYQSTDLWPVASTSSSASAATATGSSASAAASSAAKSASSASAAAASASAKSSSTSGAAASFVVASTALIGVVAGVVAVFA
uniref:Macrofage activating glycoprotein n=1 Tax=Rhodosporidiobolus colostri TaxID=255053 RepID=A0A9E9GFH0_9BASI|nr:hypothetical protein [Rhodosporidiobolus colostri]